MRYDKHKYQTGDVVAFAGQGFISEIIKLTTNCDYSHVGILVVKGNDVFCYESTSKQYTPDTLFTNEWYRGVHCFQFFERVLTYPGKVAVFPLKKKLPNEDKLVEWLENNHTNHTAFNVSGMTTLGLRKIGLKLLETSDEEELMFCSQMVTSGLKVV